MTSALEGIDTARVAAWARREGFPLVGPLEATLVEGGHSNLTYLLDGADGRRWVLRRPPLHHVVESAHDVLREFRVMSAVADSDVPVPGMVGACEDLSVLGSPFFVMEFVEGLVLHDADETERAIPEARRRDLTTALVDTFASLHRVDPEAIGLGDLGRRDDYVGRQLRRWSRQWEATAIRDVPLVGELHRRLSEHPPQQAGVAIVHGDFRLDNCIVGPTGEVRAVLDWELCTLGDPLADLGTSLAYWLHPDEAPYEGIAGPSRAAGMPTREAFVARYAERTDADLAELPYYVALACWKIAIILDGVYARYAAGAMGARDRDHEGLLRTSDRLLGRAREELDRRGPSRTRGGVSTSAPPPTRRAP